MASKDEGPSLRQWLFLSGIKENERVSRSCLSCDRAFTAQGRHNRICGPCKHKNRFQLVYDELRMLIGPKDE